MKRIVLLLSFMISAFLCSNLFAADAFTSDVQLYNEVCQTFSNGFYPGTISAVEMLQKRFPESTFTHKALAYKGEALINMNSYDEAVSTLESAVSYMHSGSSELIRSTYLLGCAYFYKNDYTTALEKFHLACSLCLTNNEMETYAPSILFSGRIFFILENYEKAKPLFEYVVSNGNLYDSFAYGEAVQKLFACYNSTFDWKKTTALYSKFSETDFENKIYLTLTLYYADACSELSEYKEAYDAYCLVIEKGDEALAVSALKKAYLISSEHETGTDSGEVLAKSQNVFKESPAFVNEFWVRLGIDEYNLKHYDKAKKYFSRIENTEGEQIFSSDVELLCSLYKAKMLLEETKLSDEAENLLIPAEKFIRKSKIENIGDAFYSTLLQCKIQGQKWDEIPAVYAKLKTPSASDHLVISSYYYKKGQYDKVTSDTGELYASSLCKLGKYEEACIEYEKSGSISSDYAKALFITGKYESSYEIASKSSDLQKDYIMGLCCINTKAWKKASEHFSLYLKNYSNKPEFQKLCLYYKGYAEYNLAKFKDSYASFVRYTIESQDELSGYTLKSYEYAVKAALQNGDFKNASLQAGNLVKFSENDEDRHKAIVLSAEIFADYGKFDEAIQLLSPYTESNNDFSAQALFLTAGMYERKNEVVKADATYKKIYENMPRSGYSEEAMYKSGEVFYSTGNYSEAFKRFNAYIYKYTSGKFSDAALYYSGDCALKLGETDRSVMMNKTMLQKYPQSVYSYGACKNLLSAYYAQENYNEALSIARNMLKNYSQQSKDDEIEKRLIELEKIVGGTDRRVAEKQTEYSKLSGAKTKAGRVAGTQLVRLYAESLYTQSEAYELASLLLPEQVASDEREDAAFNAEFIADYCRKNQENKKAAQMYLKAAENYRSVRNGERAAAALYGAAEAFAADGLSGDARETAALLKQLYPESLQAEKVDRVTGGTRN